VARRARTTLLLAVLACAATATPALAAPDDPGYPMQWGLVATRAPEVWSVTTGEGVLVAVVDSGSGPHADLAANLLPGITVRRGRVVEGADDDGATGHGTHVAGIIAAVANNGLGIAGVAPGAKVLPIKVLDARGSGSDVDLEIGIRQAVDRGARVINLSLGSETRDAGVRDAIQYALSRDVVVVAAAGNDGASAGPKWPAAEDEPLAVTAVGQDYVAPAFAQRGGYIDVAAPGVQVYATVRGDAYASLSGTSMAAAFVSGVAALVRAAQPALTAAQVRDVLTLNATDLGDAGVDATYGAGFVDAYAVFAGLGFFPAPVRYPEIRTEARFDVVQYAEVPALPVPSLVQWYRCGRPGDATTTVPADCAPIEGAVDRTYFPRRADVGGFLRLGATVTVAREVQVRLSATGGRVAGVWAAAPVVAPGLRVPLARLVRTPSTGALSATATGACRVVGGRVVTGAAGTCELRVRVAARAPWPAMAARIALEVGAPGS
jgi:hypothetical protein